MTIAPILPASPGKIPLSDYKPLSNTELSTRIEAGRKKLGKRLLILGHHYQQDEVIEHADLRGDSYQLSQLAASSSECRTIIFCGVHFMAETAKILNPEKRVLLPDLLAGCSLADSCPAPKLAAMQASLRTRGRRFQTVTYINSSAAVKALSDWVVTSGNALEIIARIPSEFEILFVPDRHLGGYLEEVTGRSMILWDGACEVHELFSLSDLLQMKRKFPQALTIAHPECPANIREHSEFVGGTKGMLAYVMKFEEPKHFLVATEVNMLWQLQRKSPQHRFDPVPGVTCACNKCPYMAKNTLIGLRDCLLNLTPEIVWQPSFDKASEVLSRSLLN